VATGIELSVLGLGTIWKSRWGYRMRLLHDHLVTLDDDKLVSSDGRLRRHPRPGTTPQLVRERYESSWPSTAARGCSSLPRRSATPARSSGATLTDPVSVPGGKGGSPFRYLNAGIMVGPAGLVRRMLVLVYAARLLRRPVPVLAGSPAAILWWVDPATGSYQVASSRLMPSSEVPPEAKPLMGLDLWNELTMALYGYSRGELPGGGGEGTLEFPLPPPGRSSCTRTEQARGNVLEELAAEFGYPYDASYVKTQPKSSGPANAAPGPRLPTKQGGGQGRGEGEQVRVGACSCSWV